jgi:hypothetical protein
MKRYLAPLAALLLASCARDAKSPETPAADSPSQSSSTDDALADLQRAERELEGALSSRAYAGPPADKAPTKKEEEERSGGAEGQAGDACGTACRALASMRRASEHLCGLTGDTDARCSDARSRLERAEGRVRASCPVCAT